jgi:hypothetical protein
MKKADPKKPWKSVMAFVLTFLGMVYVSIKGNDALADLSLQDWLAIIIPALITAGGTYMVKNPLVEDNELPQGHPHGHDEMGYEDDLSGGGPDLGGGEVPPNEV